ncbi:MAG: hypothetical protein GXX97_06720 [Dehalococcoidales bacterium]|nr:hypothetical protein [Dehalococcoidales bacterium]
MRKKLSIAIGLLLVAGLLFVGVGGSTLSAGPANDTTAFSSGAGAKAETQSGTCAVTGIPQMGGIYSADVCATVCELLGITEDELQAQRLDGLSMVEIAAGYGVTEDELVEAIMAVKTANLQELVADGTITQEEADLMLQSMLERTCEMVNATQVGHFGGNGNQGESQNGKSNSWGECSDGNGPGDRHQWGKQAR